jgi:membrane protein
MPDRIDRLSTDDHGRRPAAPGPRSRRRWRDILWRVWERLTTNHLSILAAGVAFYGFLSLFPGLVALVSIYGLIADPAAVEQHLDALGSLLPDAAWRLVNDQLQAITAHSGTSLSFTLVVSLAFAWWSAASAMKALMEALNIAYGETERRGVVLFNIEALLLTLGAMVVMILALVGVVVVPIVLQFLDSLGLPQQVGTLVAFARWPVLALFIMLGLAVLYRLGASRVGARWRWVSWGAVTTTTLWLIGSALFSYYVSAFSSYDRMYGSLAAVVVLMLWLELSAFLIILGAQLNAELEHGTVDDPAAVPTAARNAGTADAVGKSPKGWTER